MDNQNLPDKAATGLPLAAVFRGNGLFVVILFFLTPCLTMAAPGSTVVFLALLAIAISFAFYRGHGDWRQLIQPNMLLLALVLVCLYALASTLWAADTARAARRAGEFLAVVLISFTASRAVLRLDTSELSIAPLAFAAGTLLGTGFVLFELVSQGAITAYVRNAIDILNPASFKRGLVGEDGQLLRIGPSGFRQNVILVVLYLWPSLLALRSVGNRTYRSIFIGLLVVGVAVAAYLSGRVSAQLAFIASLIFFGTATYWRRHALLVLGVCWCLAFALVLPAKILAYKAELHMEPLLPTSARARIILWEFTAERVFENPWLGVGAASTRTVRQALGEPEQPEGYVYPRTFGAHAHSLFLQTWFELGLVGTVLMAFAGVAVLLRIPLLPVGVQPFAAACFACFFAILSVSFSLWYAWLTAAVGLMVVLLLAAARVREREDADVVAEQSDSIGTNPTGSTNLNPWFDLPLKILFLADEKPGHYHLAEGVIAALQRLCPVDVTRVPVQRKWIVPTRFLRWRIDHKTFWPPRMLRMAYRIIAEDLPKADLVVSAGGETLMPNICAARYLGVPNIFCGSLRGLDPENFSLVISSYDRDVGSPRHLVALKPSAIDPGALGRSAASARRFDADTRPERIGLLTGGNAGLFRYRRDEWQALLDFVKALSVAWGTRWLISTSRRTPDFVADAVSRLAEDKATVDTFIDFRIAGPGTLPQIFAQADAILCTEDSSSMMSEAVSAQLPVVGVSPARHRFTQEEADYRAFMLGRNWCRVLPIAGLSPEAFGAALAEIEPLQENPLDALAAKLRERLPKLFAG